MRGEVARLESEVAGLRAEAKASEGALRDDTHVLRELLDQKQALTRQLSGQVGGGGGRACVRGFEQAARWAGGRGGGEGGREGS